MKKKQITFSDERYLNKAIRELHEWGVRDTRWALHEDAIITKDTNVVDVIAETFMFHTNVYEIVNIRRIGGGGEKRNGYRN